MDIKNQLARKLMDIKAIKLQPSYNPTIPLHGPLVGSLPSTQTIVRRCRLLTYVRL